MEHIDTENESRIVLDARETHFAIYEYIEKRCQPRSFKKYYNGKTFITRSYLSFGVKIEKVVPKKPSRIKKYLKAFFNRGKE